MGGGGDALSGCLGTGHLVKGDCAVRRPINEGCVRGCNEGGGEGWLAG